MTPQQITQLVCDNYHCKPEEIKTNLRREGLSQCRLMTVYLIFGYTNLTTIDIAEFLSKKNSSIHDLVKKSFRCLKTDLEFKSMASKLRLIIEKNRLPVAS